MSRSRGAGRRAGALGLGVLLVCAGVARAQPAPTIVQGAPGRIEVSAVDPTLAHAVSAAADEGWRLLEGPLGLPAAFPSPVFVRLIPASEGPSGAPFRVSVEAGGVVSVWLRVAALSETMLRRALVQGLLMRLAVAQHGIHENLTAPLWLEHACTVLWRIRAEPAQLDALKLASAGVPVPALADLLAWPRGADEPAGWTAASFWLLVHLQAESGRGREWPTALRRLLGGEEAGAALAAAYPAAFTSAAERELWWQTGWHQSVQARTLPVLDAAASRLQLGALARFVFAGADETHDVVVPMRRVLERGSDAPVVAELARRAAELGRLNPALHPFYRNAGLALLEACRSRGEKPARIDALCAAFEQDWADGQELERVTTAALDALEARRGARGVPASR